jgi:hypothetical protein
MAIAPSSDKNALVQSQFKKTSMCKFYMQGACKKNNECPFAHASEELCAAPDLSKTSLCKAWKEGKCKRTAKQCPFAHGVHELKMTPLFEQASRKRDVPKAALTQAAHRCGAKAGSEHVARQTAPVLPRLSPPGELKSEILPPLQKLLNFEQTRPLPSQFAVVGCSNPCGSLAQLSVLIESALGAEFHGGDAMARVALEQLLTSALPDSYED